MDTNSGSMHFVMVPWLAFGHILPFTELVRRIALQGHRVTLLSTPRNTRRLITIPRDLEGLVHVVDVLLPRLPEDAEATIDLPSDELRPCLRRAFDAAFSAKLSDILQGPEPSKPDWVLIDYARGVRLVLLPLLFDQGLNARHMVEKKIAVEVARDEEDGSFTAEDVKAALRRVMVEDDGEEFGAKVPELAEVLGSDEVNDQCVRDFLRCLSEYSRAQQR